MSALKFAGNCGQRRGASDAVNAAGTHHQRPLQRRAKPSVLHWRGQHCRVKLGICYLTGI